MQQSNDTPTVKSTPAYSHSGKVILFVGIVVGYFLAFIIIDRNRPAISAESSIIIQNGTGKLNIGLAKPAPSL